ncbi:AI-2E family transporter [Flavobacterium sp.]|uniref:AI-2E family transporter n=1 Tax=Flavobacterium sp. TaxID=239 RepID=UPI003753005D
MIETIKLPFYAKFAFVLLALLLSGYLFYIGQGIIVPILLAFFIAIILRPIVDFFNKKLRLPNVIAIALTVTFFVILILGIFTIISMQISDMVNDFDKIQRNLNTHLSHFQNFVRENFNLSKKEQAEYIDDATVDSIEKGKELIGTTLLSFSDTLLNAILIPIYIFLILLYKSLFVKFFEKLVSQDNKSTLFDILEQIKVVVKSYIVGLILEMIFISVLTSVGLMIIGVKYAILLGVITGLLNIIPYIGILVAGILTIVATLTGSADLSVIIGVIIVNLIVQLIDNNLLVPLIVSSKVKINALVSIVGIIIGGAMAGISGMFLAIPIIAILKVIFDRIETLEPWGYLMGDTLPKTYEWHNIRFPRYDFENFTDTTPNSNEINIEIVKAPTSETSE